MQSCGNISRALGHCHRETTHLVAFLGISFKGYLKMCGVFRTTFQSNVGYFSVVQSLNRVWLFGTLWTAGHQAPLSSTISWSLLKFMSLESVMLSNHLSLCHPLLLLPSIFSSIRVFSSESALRIRWPNYWSFSFSPSSEFSGLISFRIDWFALLAVQGTFRSLVQHCSPKASILWCSAFFTVQLSQSYVTIWKSIVLTVQTVVRRVMSVSQHTV